MSLRLIIEDDEGSTTIVPLGRDAITIGRQQGNTIQLTEKNVSRRHAQLLPEGQTWVLEDLGSYNGVKVNGRPASGRVVLQEG
ncbi:MAG: FHA domain-containing protein, partial [Myxococcales bacterium]|nr:FHA domain-containing protein [Myxococcales bacterium]